MFRPLALLCLLAGPVLAQDVVTYDTDQSFDDVLFGLENAIVDQGLVVSATSHVGEMLDRTRADVGSDVVLFEQAEVLSFCSAVVSRKVMEVDPLNIRFCPYDIFVFTSPDTPDQTTIGFRSFPEGAMKEVETLLDTITRAAIGLDD
ncbi:hypothetical protein [Puniceibacterium sp. IMCC21224]|uniref:hypothetical protein n=1 Tax=Puniceibacterium sp. IMCC21224 TaxID=1618204 RepID=UPI00064DD20E|nr:hypothetical protein [Puniceibacterium sp. IMCC21224]KMK65177.1 hypothetical protein IMCC21224_117 [Puniceibacterium sp. IMCC21224]